MNAVTKPEGKVAVHKSIASALAAAQADMGPALKDANNPHFRTKYADLSSVMNACLPALNAHGIAVVQPPYDDDTGRYVKTILIHGDTEQTLECRIPLIVAKNDMQGYGSAVTYARRYGLMSMAGIAPEDDDGNAAAKAPPVAEDRPRQQEKRRDTTLTAEQIASQSLARAETLDALAAIWHDLPRAVQGDASVIKAKDDRKVSLQRAADLGDEIPY